MQLELHPSEPIPFAIAGAGNTNSLIGSCLYASAPSDLFTVIGQCPSVGLSGG